MNKYKFNKYNPKIKRYFYYEKNRLLKFLPKNLFIEHVGSTSIEGLGGKGILDLMVGTSRRDLISTKNLLIKNGYNFKESGGEKDRLFFKRYSKYKGKMRLIHIQLIPYKSQMWNNMILVRDYLRTNPQARKEYSEIKKNAVKYAKGEGKKYRKFKEEFLKGLIRNLNQ